MKDNATGSVRISYYSSCVGDGPIRQTNKCSGLRVGSRVQFTGKGIVKTQLDPMFRRQQKRIWFLAKIEVVKCPKDPREWHQVFEIYPVGINEKVLVELDMMCQCDCETPGHRVSQHYFNPNHCMIISDFSFDHSNFP